MTEGAQLAAADSEAFGGFYRNKTVLVTGSTGFKGSWLSLWLTRLGAKVVGYALEPETTPNHFSVCRLASRITQVYADVRDVERLGQVVRHYQPDVVFHLAAQALVRRSFELPRYTFEVNVMGSINVLEAARAAPCVRAAVLITSDKCYANAEWVWGYRETDALGGYDAYSASKACAELAIAVYRDPRFQTSVQAPFSLPIASTRAGNVIGGGDWSEGRIVPDCVRALHAELPLTLRNPDATRPWQHVLEPLSGYLWLGALLASDPERRFCEAWNFGPPAEAPLSVGELAQQILAAWPRARSQLVLQRAHSAAEAQLLRLDCSKAEQRLGWRATFSAPEMLTATVNWYRSYYDAPDAELSGLSAGQIDQFTRLAAARGLSWANAAALERHLQRGPR